jgi:tRNA pseudouridine13 synthase
VPVPHGLDAERLRQLAELSLPLPSARLHLDPADPRGELVREVLAEEGLELRDMQVKGIRELFFSRGERAALFLPAEMGSRIEADELHTGRQKLILRFDLPRGCYATMVVKCALDAGPRLP